MIGLSILSGGAAEGLMKSMAPDLERAGIRIGGSFGAVGAMRDKLLAGEPADILILTKALVDQLQGSRDVIAGSGRDIGVVRTSVAARRGDLVPSIESASLLRQSLLEADEFHVPDLRQSTAGQHINKMLQSLDLVDMLRPTLREHPNGMTAMRALSRSAARRPLGCTQKTEIVSTDGVVLVRDLPGPFELATTYTAAIASRSSHVNVARTTIELLVGETTGDLRRRAGFERA